MLRQRHPGEEGLLSGGQSAARGREVIGRARDEQEGGLSGRACFALGAVEGLARDLAVPDLEDGQPRRRPRIPSESLATVHLTTAHPGPENVRKPVKARSAGKANIRSYRRSKRGAPAVVAVARRRGRGRRRRSCPRASRHPSPSERRRMRGRPAVPLRRCRRGRAGCAAERDAGSLCRPSCSVPRPRRTPRARSFSPRTVTTSATASGLYHPPTANVAAGPRLPQGRPLRRRRSRPSFRRRGVSVMSLFLTSASSLPFAEA